MYSNAQPSLHCTSQSLCLLHVNTKRSEKNPSFFVTHIQSERKRFSLPVYFLCAKSAFRCPLAIFASIQLDSTQYQIKWFCTRLRIYKIHTGTTENIHNRTFRCSMPRNNSGIEKRMCTRRMVRVGIN